MSDAALRDIGVERMDAAPDGYAGVVAEAPFAEALPERRAAETRKPRRGRPAPRLRLVSSEKSAPLVVRR